MGERPGTRFRCVACGKLTAGRIPRDGRHRGDTSARFPRRHYVGGKPCPGLSHEAEWVTVERRASRATPTPGCAPPRDGEGA